MVDQFILLHNDVFYTIKSSRTSVSYEMNVRSEWLTGRELIDTRYWRDMYIDRQLAYI
jgi:hypothetical protein